MRITSVKSLEHELAAFETVRRVSVSEDQLLTRRSLLGHEAHAEAERKDPSADCMPRHARPIAPSTGVARRHGLRFTAFSAIGSAVFVTGAALQWLLVHLGLGAVGSYVWQAVFSIELSFALNRWLIWHCRKLKLASALAKWNVQRLALTVPNLLGYAALVHVGLQWIWANMVITATFTLVNYLGADMWAFRSTRHRKQRGMPIWPWWATRPFVMAGFTAANYEAAGRWSFVTRAPAQNLPLTPLPDSWLPTVSVVIPCKGNERTIRPTVESLLAQDYPRLAEVICVGDVGDSTWSALRDVADQRLIIIEQEAEQGLRDPNVKRDKGLTKASGEVLALADSDIVMTPGWLSHAIELLREQGAGLVAGGMRSIHDSFWGRFVDSNTLAAKTPRLPRPYLVNEATFGRRGHKPPITANAVFSRELYEATPLDVTWFYGYEDYEWFWRVAKAGHLITFSGALTAMHHHRRSLRKLAQEYRRSAEGCARFVRVHRNCPLARKRLYQAIGLPLALCGTLAGAGVALAAGLWLPLAVAAGAAAMLVTGREVWRSRRVEALIYPFIALVLGGAFTMSLLANLVRARPLPDAERRILWDEDTVQSDAFWRYAASRISWPLAAILAVQAAFSLSLVWSNTVFGDEATYLWQGQAEWAHWLHRTAIPVFHDSGAPQLYPPVGAIADAIGGLAGARILSLCFMLLAATLLYLIGKMLFGERAALIGVALWAVSEPVLRLAFATYDPLACLLVILSLWLALQAGVRSRHGELVALAAISLALACTVAYSFAIMTPAVVVVAFFAWQSFIGVRLAIWCAGWLAGASAVISLIFYTILHSWSDVLNNVTHDGASLGAGISSVLRSAWSWDNIIFALAAAGVIMAFSREHSQSRKLLVLSLAVSGLLVPIYQAHLGIGFGLDKHVSAGSGMMALAAGYVFSRVELPACKPAITWATAVACLTAPAVTGLWYARSTFHLWQNISPVVADVNSALKSHPGPVTGPGMYILQFYFPGNPYTNSGSLKPLTAAGIKKGSYSLVVSELNANLSSASLPVNALREGSPKLNTQILDLATSFAANAGHVNSSAVLQEIERSHHYAIKFVIPFGISDVQSPAGITIIWERVR
jgi:glycosyltransferase involved in cell wall biosynthesis